MLVFSGQFILKTTQKKQGNAKYELSDISSNRVNQSSRNSAIRIHYIHGLNRIDPFRGLSGIKPLNRYNHSNELNR